MEIKLIDEKDLSLMLDFKDDVNTQFSIANLRNFIKEENNYGFVVRDGNKIVAFAYGYVLIMPQGNKVFYLHAIDVIKDSQNKGVGTELMQFICSYIKQINCSEMFLITNKSNFSACKCYEKAGCVSESKDDIVYVFE